MAYQSEAQLEKQFIEQLRGQNYQVVNFTPNDCKNTKNYEDLCQDTIKSNMAET